MEANVTELWQIVEALQVEVGSMQTDMDSLWLMVGAILVVFMQAGFTMLEVGSVGAKHTKNLLIKNLLDLAVAAVMWWAVGWGLAFGTGSEENGFNQFFGPGSFFARGEEFEDEAGNYGTKNGYNWALWLFQWSFSGTAVTIVSGAVGERICMSGYFLFSQVMVGLIYPMVVRWGWNSHGWASAWSSTRDDLLFGCGVIDFAGSGVVHATGGMAALVMVILIGPRLGRFSDEGANNKMERQSAIIEVDSWLDFSDSFSSEHLATLNKHLGGRSFLAGGAFSLADVAVYFACAAAVAAAPPAAGKQLHLCRWFNQVQHRVRLLAPSCPVLPPTVTLNIFSPVAVPLPAKQPATSSGAAQSATAGSAAAAAAVAAPAGGVGNEKSASASGPAEGKKDKKKKKKGAAAGGEDGNGKTAAPAAAAKGVPGEAKKGAESAAPAAAEGDPSKLDVRVGTIVKAWEHPDSEKLFCEEIDLGEGSNRNIASGLRAFYTLEEMQGRRVIVLANLKPRNIGGFKSNGMVLCASSEDHSVVKIVEPPPGAAIGARVTVSGTEGEPATPAQVQKKKILEKCAPKLKTNSDGLPGYDGVGVFNVDGEPCVATIPGAFVS